MATPYYLIYHECSHAQGLEWATKYCWVGDGADGATAAAIAEAEALLVHESLTFTRWEWINSAGVKEFQGNLTGIEGVRTGEVLPIHYAALLRLNTSGGLNRPSSRYIHGCPESFTTNGESSSNFNDARADYMTALNAAEVLANYVDSDGFSVNGHGFRGWSRRKRMRRKSL